MYLTQGGMDPQNNEHKESKMKRITIESENGTYTPRLETIIDWLDRQQRPAFYEWHSDWMPFEPGVTAENWIDHVTFKSLCDLYGNKKIRKGCFFFQDNGLPTGYGQFFIPVEINSNSSVTGRVSVIIRVDGETVDSTSELREALREE